MDSNLTIPHIEHEKILVVAEILKTIGHPLRLNVLQVLSNEPELCVSDIQRRLENQIEQSLLSHHLIKMRDKGILKSEKKGMQKFYSIRDTSILKIFDCMDKCNF